MGWMGWFARAARLKTLPVALWPAAFGLAFRYGGWTGPVWARAALALIATALLHVGASLCADLVDHRSGAAKLARMEKASIPTGSGVVLAGGVSQRGVTWLAGGFLAASVLMWIPLRNAFVFGLVAAVFAIPWKRVPALVEALLHAVARGGLPMLAASAAFGGPTHGRVVLAACIPAGFALVVHLHEQLLQWRADRAAERKSVAVSLEPERALLVTGTLITLLYATLIVEVAFRVLAPWSLLGLASAAPLARAWGRAARDPAPQHFLRLLGASLGASLLTGITLVVVTALG